MEYNYTSLNPGKHNINLNITCKHGNSINSNYDFTLIDAIHNAKLILTDITDSDSDYDSKIFNYNIIPDNPSSTKIYAWDEYTYALILDDSDAIPLTSPTGTQTFTNLSEGEHNLVLQINCKHGVTKYTSSKFEIIEPCYIDLTNVEYSIDKTNYNITYNLINPHFDTEELTYNVILNDTNILTENNSYNYSNLNPGDYNFGISLLSCKHKHNKNLPNYNFKLLEILDYTNLSLENITEEPNLPNDSTLDDADQSTYKTYYISQYVRIILEFQDNSCKNGWFYNGPTLNHFYLDRDPVTQLHSFSTTDNIVTAYYESVPIIIDLLNSDTIMFGNTKYSLSYNQPGIDKHFPDNYDVSSTYTFKYNTTLTDNKLLFACDQLHGQLILDDTTTYNCNSALSGIIEIDTTSLSAGKHKLDFIVICQHGNVKTQSIEFNVDSYELPEPAKNTLRFQFSQKKY